MNQEEMLQLALNERKKTGLTIEQFEKKAGVRLTHYRDVLNTLRGKPTRSQDKNRLSVSLLHFTKVLDALDLQLVIEDKDAEWGEDMARLRMMPKKLYVGERIEAREVVQTEGFYPRVDLFEHPEQVLKFLPGNCDIYEIRLGKLNRKKFDVIEHPFGAMYSYNDWISPEAIVNRVTHR